MILKQASDSLDSVQILGIDVHLVSMEDTMCVFKGFLEGGGSHIVVTADSSGVVTAQHDAQYREIVKSASLVTPDSHGILWAARRKGHRISHRVSGVDLVDELCRLSADKGYRVFLLGSAPGVAELAAERLRLRHPGCNIVGAKHGFFPSDSDRVVAQEIAKAKPDILLVAMGIPRQEKFIAGTADIIGAKIAMGVGGSLDVFSGKAKRAPVVVQKLHAEWLWRLLLNPRKIKKVGALPVFVWRVMREK